MNKDEKELPETIENPILALYDIFTNYEHAKQYLTIKLCDTEEKSDFLQKVVHKDISDFSATYQISLGNIEDGYINVTLKPDHLKAWGISEETLHEDALDILREQPPILTDLEDIMSNIVFGKEPENLLTSDIATESPLDSDTLYCLSNLQRVNGASYILQNELLEQIGELFSHNFYILPSSVHEILIISSDTEYALSELSSMVSETNRTKVTPEDKLSDKIQYYDRFSKTLENANKRDARIASQKFSTRLPFQSEILYDIYQVKDDEEHHMMRFSSLKTMKHFDQHVEMINYDKVYSGSISKSGATNEMLESLYEKFNLQHPADYRGHSMSVSDVVVLYEHGVKTAHFCDSMGFVEIPNFLLPAPTVNLETSGLTVDGHLGTWHTIGSLEIAGKDFYLMEHDEFGSEVANIIVDENGKLVAEDIWHGVNYDIERMIIEEQGLLSAKAVSMPERETVAATGNQPLQIADSSTDSNYLANAEGNSEENYNQIDGRIDTQSKLTPGDDTDSHPEKQPERKPSVLAKLKQNQDVITASQKNAEKAPPEKIKNKTDLTLD